MTPDERTKRDKDDLAHLIPQQQFTRFLLRVIQSARIFDTATDGSHDEAVSALARRNLGLEILGMVEAGQTIPHPDGLPILTVFQALREEANQPGDKHAKRDRYDRNAELDDAPDEG